MNDEIVDLMNDETAQTHVFTLQWRVTLPNLSAQEWENTPLHSDRRTMVEGLLEQVEPTLKEMDACLTSLRQWTATLYQAHPDFHGTMDALTWTGDTKEVNENSTRHGFFPAGHQRKTGNPSFLTVWRDSVGSVLNHLLVEGEPEHDSEEESGTGD